MISTRKLATYLLVAACSAGAVGWAVGAKWEIKYKALQLEQANGTIKVFAEFGENFTDALQNAEITRGKNDQAQQAVNATLRSLRNDISGLHSNVSELTRNATPGALAEYATTCTAVFANVAAGGERLSEIGAGISSKAEGHAVDAKQTVDAWPRLK